MRPEDGPFAVHLSEAAAGGLRDAMGRSPAMMRRELRRTAWVAARQDRRPGGRSAGGRSAGGASPAWLPVDGLIKTQTPLYVAIGEVLTERRVLLVYAVLSRRELMRRFMGPDIHRRWRNRRLGRLLHGRW
jgi:hypothetical protein